MKSFAVVALLGAVAAQDVCKITKIECFSDETCGTAKTEGCPTLEQANAGVKDVGKCNELIKDSLSFKMVCDATSFRSEYFKDAKCETTQPDVPEPHKSLGAASEPKWGVCRKDGAGGSMMVSGAQALTATVAAGAALFASLY